VIKVPPAHGVGVFGVYTLGENQTAHDVFAMQDELLRSEGIDPAWVPSTAAELLQVSTLPHSANHRQPLPARRAETVGERCFKGAGQPSPRRQRFIR